jgi:predicted enzyme related to lactoylglutathione lyase
MEYYTLSDSEGGVYRAGVLQMTAQWGELPPHWMVYLAVDDVDAAVARVQELGGKAHHGPFDTPYGRMAVVADPQGAVFSVMQPSQLAHES